MNSPKKVTLVVSLTGDGKGKFRVSWACDYEDFAGSSGPLDPHAASQMWLHFRLGDNPLVNRLYRKYGNALVVEQRLPSVGVPLPPEERR